VKGADAFKGGESTGDNPKEAHNYVNFIQVKNMGKHKISLQNVVDTRRYLSGLINRVEEGDIDANQAGKLTFICNTLLKAQELECIERRLLELEDRQAINVTPQPTQITEG
jgi:Asp-tRNA(Asn)/Glu-tRNA(Gln) amidotransferase B subunit